MLTVKSSTNQGGGSTTVITEPLTVSTLAGQALTNGSADGTGSGARFYYPAGVATDNAGNLYIADTDNHTIREVVAATGAVNTLAGLAGVSGSADGTGSEARFNSPSGVAVDGSGNVYVADTLNNTLREVTPSGVVSTLAGNARQQRQLGRHGHRRPVQRAAGPGDRQRGQSLRGRHQQ